MCGLVGMAGNIVDGDKKVLKHLLIFDVLRGDDSTGLAVVSEKDDSISLVKEVGAPHNLFRKSEFDSKGVYTSQRGKVFIGHNRAATKGAVTKKNAHPFHHGNVVGAHNGTLRGAFRLENSAKFDVDSEAIFYNLAKYTIESTMGNVDGAYALTWYDKDDNKVYVIRNNERPLYWTRRTDLDVIYWASEPWMLEVALGRCSIKHGDIVEFEKNTLYSLDVSNVMPSTFRKVEWVEKKNVEGYKYKPVVRHNNHNNGSHIFNNPSNVNQGGRSNVIPFSPTSNGGSTQSAGRTATELSVMKQMEGQTIRFRLSGVKVGVSKSRYLSAFPDNPLADWDIRIYGHKNSLWGNWVDAAKGKNLFSGKIKKVVDTWHSGGKRETYLLIDLRSIEKQVETEVEEELPKSNTVSDTDWYEGLGGRFLTRDEWDNATKDGCANCTADADPDDQLLTFFSHNEHFCGKCADANTKAESNPRSNLN